MRHETGQQTVQKQRRKPERPPYAPVKGVREFFEKVSSKGRPTVINKEYLAALGVAAGNEQHLVGALKWLGLIEEDGRPSSHYDILYLKGPERRRGLQNLLRQAYPSLFVGELDLQSASRSEVHDHFVQRYGLHGQIARKASALFALLCALAEFSISPDLSRSRESAKESRKRSKATDPPASRSAPESSRGALRVDMGHTAAVLHGWPVLLTLGPEMTEDEIVAFLSRVKRAVARLEETSSPP